MPIEKGADTLMPFIPLDSSAGEWVEKAPNDITYKLELLEEYNGTMLFKISPPNAKTSLDDFMSNKLV